MAAITAPALRAGHHGVHVMVRRTPNPFHADPRVLFVSPTVFNHLCGWPEPTFTYVYDTYCGSGTPINKPYKLFVLFVYQRHYPTTTGFTMSAFFNSCSRSWQLRRIHVMVAYLAQVLDELRPTWDARQSAGNRLPYNLVADHRVTGSLDTFPIYVVRPKDARWQRYLYNGKYRGHVLKVQVVCDHSGAVIWYSGPHIGTTADIKLADQHRPPFAPGERYLADKAYCRPRNPLPHVIAPFKKKASRRGQPPSRLTRAQEAYNRVLQWYRSSVEHSIGHLKRFRILSVLYRGRLNRSNYHINHVLRVIMHVSSYHIRHHPHRVHLPIFDPALDADLASSSSDSSASDDSGTDGSGADEGAAHQGGAVDSDDEDDAKMEGKYDDDGDDRKGEPDEQHTEPFDEDRWDSRGGHRLYRCELPPSPGGVRVVERLVVGRPHHARAWRPAARQRSTGGRRRCAAESVSATCTSTARR